VEISSARVLPFGNRRGLVCEALVAVIDELRHLLPTLGASLSPPRLRQTRLSEPPLQALPSREHGAPPRIAISTDLLGNGSSFGVPDRIS